MQTMFVGITEARRRLDELLAATNDGREVVITRRGKPVVRLQQVGLVEARKRQDGDTPPAGACPIDGAAGEVGR